MKEQVEEYFSRQTPKIETQIVTDIVYQLFYTFCFEFDPESHERILDRKMFFGADVHKASDLLEKCDRKLLQLLVSDLGAPEKMDGEIAALILYGGVLTPKVLDHIADLVLSE
ncbi:hypothetical protein [Candidatus Villigracilis saccharophilus]|uniref:hypothetical protein n=1 Tax=Candidatus Villigracilis saccharophilus TaxID=3140684 RepID=UPI00313763BC|nr:hypothetical protein [Anaerolineales bacterium]